MTSVRQSDIKALERVRELLVEQRAAKDAARAKVAKKAVAGQGARKDAPKPAPRKRSK